MNLSRFLKKIFFASVMIFAVFAFSSCQYVIYASIRKEVTLKDSSVEGVVRSIIRVSSGGTEYLYITNGGEIFRKPNSGNSADHSYGGWQKVCSNKDIGSSDYIMALAADSDHIYAFVAWWDENTDKGQNRWNARAIYASADGKEWTEVRDIDTDPTDTEDDNPALYLFCTNTIKNENRSAYFNYDGTGYKLNGTNAPTEEANASANKDKKDDYGAASCAFINDKVEFAHASDKYYYYGSASCTNEAKDNDATIRYYSKGGTTLYWDGAVTGSRKADVHIYSLAVTADYILVGTAGGIEHYKLNADGSVGGEESFKTNADAIMSGGYEVNSLLVINPEKNETETAIYAATDFEGRYKQFDHACLWAYYPERGNWNRD